MEKAASSQPDVIVLDISLPNMNGLQAAREIKRQLPQIQIIMVSQHEASVMAPQAFNAGAREYIAKSNVSNELLAAITRIKYP